MTQAITGWMIGHFEPLHQGHIRLIQHAVGIVEQLHIVILKHPAPNPHFPVTLADKARWLQTVFGPLPFIHIHTQDIANPDASQPDAATVLQNIRLACAIDESAKFISDESQAWRSHLNPEHYIALTYHQEYDSEHIHSNPIRYWPDIHRVARRDYTRSVVIAGGESSGKTTLIYKLANHFMADYCLEQGRLYVDYALGGSELALQYSDYARIGIDHAQAADAATERGSAPVTLIDTDFVTTQAFCETYEGRRDPIIATLAREKRFHHTLLLANNTLWVDDGMRSLGSEEKRTAFQKCLKGLYHEYAIPYHEITHRTYQERYRAAVTYIQQHIYGESG
ncbi:MAG: multifunctional transcriptional regulator/nicotinamide-nucleotide adenylyltransferase/ribosylnicotinamide kinase NadR [Cardiobacteriaceae bacterium]|nr:multifunctional transcriptional regulator/nicotinamide-nucleotide adenylyltransferase/ribosylnicotinamide kinase NadR [Cardiobacteriaceae bacterium]